MSSHNSHPSCLNAACAPSSFVAGDDEQAQGSPASPLRQPGHGEGSESGDSLPLLYEGVFSSRAVSSEFRDARGYVEWTTENRDPVREAYKGKLGPGRTGSSRCGTMTKYAGQSDGIVMFKHTPPGLDLEDPLPQLRPYNEVVRRTKPSFHPSERPKLWPINPRTGKKLSPKWFRTFARAVKQGHIDSDYHRGTNDEDVHFEEEMAKYLLAPGKTGKRLDANPLFSEADFENSPRVYFILEGNLKADACGTAGGIVFDVPSVTLWDAPELPDFAKRFLRGKEVIIVCDSDWYSNDQVKRQALLCRQFLRDLGVDEAHIAAPPERPGKTHKERKQGLDDYLRGGGTLDGLLVLDLEARPRRELGDWIVQHGGKRRDERALEGFSLLVGEGGKLNLAPLRTMGRFMHCNRSTVKPILERLIECGAVETDKPLDVEDAAERAADKALTRAPWLRKWWLKKLPSLIGKDLNWKGSKEDRATVNLHPDLRPTQTLVQLGEFARSRQDQLGLGIQDKIVRHRRWKEEYLEIRDRFTTKTGRFKAVKYKAEMEREYKEKLRAEAVRLRKRGHSLGEIVKLLPPTKVTMHEGGIIDVKRLSKQTIKNWTESAHREEHQMQQQFEQAMSNVDAALKRIESKIDLESTLSTLRYGRMLRERGEEFGTEDVLLPIPEQRKAA
jgi:hypothetical protein